MTGAVAFSPRTSITGVSAAACLAVRSLSTYAHIKIVIAGYYPQLQPSEDRRACEIDVTLSSGWCSNGPLGRTTSSDKSGCQVSKQNLDMDHMKFGLAGILREEIEEF